MSLDECWNCSCSIIVVDSYYNNNIGSKLASFKYRKQIVFPQKVIAIAHLLSWT
jgi:hypothetical protein